MLAGLLSGAIAALVASLISLPLKSPDDAFLNTGSIAIGAIIAGVVAGVLRSALSARTFALVWAGAFVVTLGALLLVPFDGMLQFAVPLAAVVFTITGLGVTVVDAAAMPKLPIAAGGAAVLARGVGIALAGQGDAESGALSLPAAPATMSASGTTSTPASTSGTASTGAAASATSTAAAATTGARGTNGLPMSYATAADLKNVTFVVGEGSRATFTVNEKLAQLQLPNDAVMRTTALTGQVRLDGRPSTITLDLLKLTSDSSRRDQFVQRMFQQRPTAVLTVPAIAGLPERYEAGQVVKQTVQGTLAINGVERPITFDVEARIDGAVLNILGKTSFVWKDFDITPPNTPTVSVQDRVAVEVLLATKPQAG